MNIETKVQSRAGSAIKEACFTRRLQLENRRCQRRDMTGYSPTGASIKFYEMIMQWSLRKRNGAYRLKGKKKRSQSIVWLVNGELEERERRRKRRNEQDLA